MNEISDLDTGSICLHKSRWAVTVKNGSIIRKRFLHLNTAKICKEVSLLRLSSEIEINLMFDANSLEWYYEMPYLDLYPFHIYDNQQATFTQLHRIFNSWNSDERYCKLTQNEWNAINIPYYSEILKRYFPSNYGITSYLSELTADHFIHGDFTTSNVYYDESGRIIVLDYENATVGPYKWDESTLAYSFIENLSYDMAQKVIDEFHCSKQMLLAIAAIRLAQIRRKQGNDADRYRAYWYILENFN